MSNNNPRYYTFHIVWEIEFDGEAHQDDEDPVLSAAIDATQQVLEVMRDPHSVATVFSVTHIESSRHFIFDMEDDEDRVISDSYKELRPGAEEENE